MLGRKQSIKVGDAGPAGLGLGLGLGLGQLQAGGGPSTGGELGAANGPGEGAAAVSAALELAHGSAGVAWFNKTSVRHFMRLCSVASLLSVCANTSRTFSWYPTLMLITFVVDLVSGAVFSIEMVLKIYNRGLFKGPSPYARDRWCQFDAAMVLFIWISVLLQVSGVQRSRPDVTVRGQWQRQRDRQRGRGAERRTERELIELPGPLIPNRRRCRLHHVAEPSIRQMEPNSTGARQIFEIFHIVEPYSVLSVLRSPRPLILVRFIRVFLKFSMPKSRIKQIFKRSSQQIYNVSPSGRARPLSPGLGEHSS